MEQSLTSLAQKVGGVVRGESSTVITGVAAIEDAKEGDITFVDSDQLLPLLHETKASAALVSHEMPGVALPLLIVANARVALAKILALFVEKPYVSQGVSEKAWVSASATLGKDVTIYPYAYIGDEVRIGSRVTMYPGVYVGPQAEIGDDTIIYPNASVYSRCLIGKRVILQAGAVIGADGFGFVRDGEVPLELPRKAAALDFGVLRKTETGPSGAHRTRGTQKATSKDAAGCILAWDREAETEIPNKISVRSPRYQRNPTEVSYE